MFDDTEILTCRQKKSCHIHFCFLIKMMKWNNLNRKQLPRYSLNWTKFGYELYLLLYQVQHNPIFVNIVFSIPLSALCLTLKFQKKNIRVFLEHLFNVKLLCATTVSYITNFDGCRCVHLYSLHSQKRSRNAKTGNIIIMLLMLRDRPPGGVYQI